MELSVRIVMDLTSASVEMALKKLTPNHLQANVETLMNAQVIRMGVAKIRNA